MSSLEKKVIRKPLLFYFSYWILYLLFFTYQRYEAYSGGEDSETLLTSFLINLIYLPEVVIITHLVVNYVIPKFYFEGRFKKFYIIFGAIVILYPVIPYSIRVLIVDRYVKAVTVPYALGNYFAAILIFVSGITILSFNKIMLHLKEDALFHKKLDNDRLTAMLRLRESELKLLKSQIYPHFLFNTLNNLYSLALEKSDKTPDLIIRLGDMLSYIIYDCDSDKVLLSKEIEFLKSFIELQRIRYESCDISFDISGDIDTQKIAPMLLHTFIDNSFKHGAAKIQSDSWIKVSLAVFNGYLMFSVLNNMLTETGMAKEAEGIGIDNALKRLDLLYKERYDMKLDKSDSIFSVSLKLQL